MTKYEKWYTAITIRGKNRQLDSYTESHHIIPKSLGGSNNRDNISILTAREHFICHWLLVKIYSSGEEHWKMLNALRMMRSESEHQQRYHTKITSRVYENLKKSYSIMKSEIMKGDSNPVNRPDVVEKIRETKTGKKRAPFSDEWKRNLSKSRTGEKNHMYGKTHKEKTIEKIRKKAIGRKQSEETIAKKADAIRGSKRYKKLCIHCGQYIAVNGYARWHGDNCKKVKKDG